MKEERRSAWDRVWVGANLATMQPGTDPYGTRLDAAIAVRGEAIAWIGASADAVRIAAQDGVPVHDASGRWITPGLIDCHTHLVYGGNRVAEFERRLRGESYEDIARTGGGIQSTVRATRAASHRELYAGAARRAARLMAEGVTTIEIKSGYGLDGATERRLLEVARSLGRELPVSIRTTYLGLHALPEEFGADRRAYVEAASGPWLDAIVGAGLADAADAFCDSIGFTVGETEGYLGAARRAGLAVRVHAGQLCDIGAAELAARCGALSADHLEYLSVAGVSALAEAGTVAVLLPCAYFMLHQQDPPPVAALRQAGVPIAVATDCNPGTAPCTSILIALAMACTLFGLRPEEALQGATVNAARALGLAGDRGTLEVGKRADFALWEIDRPAELCYGLGANPCVGVVYGGRERAAV